MLGLLFGMLDNDKLCSRCFVRKVHKPAFYPVMHPLLQEQTVFVSCYMDFPQFVYGYICALEFNVYDNSN